MSLKLFLDTKDTSTIKNGLNNTPSDSTFIFGEILPDSITNVSCYLESASIPNIVYNIRATNNTLTFFENSGAVLKTATLSPAQYDANSLASALQTAMNSAGSNTYTISYSSLLRKLTIATTLPFTFQIQPSSTLLSNIGFDAMTTFATSKQADYQVNLLASRYIDVVVNFNCASVALNKRNNILQRIHLNDNTGSVIFYQAQVQAATVTSAHSLRQIEVRLYDDQGNLYNIDKNHSCTYNLVLQPLD